MLSEEKSHSRMGREGSVAVEFALVLPILVLLLFGIVEFGILFFDKAVITNASREGARTASLRLPPTDAAITTNIENYCRARIISFDGNPAVSAEVSRAGTDVSFTVQFRYNFLVLDSIATLFPGDFSEGVNLDATTVMRME